MSDSLATPWTVACQAALFTGFPRQAYWSGLPFPSPEDLSNQGVKPVSPALQADSLPLRTGEAHKEIKTIIKTQREWVKNYQRKGFKNKGRFQISIYSSNSGVQKLRPWAKSGQPPVFINKILWENSHAHLLTYSYGCYCNTKLWQRLPCKVKNIYYQVIYRKKYANPWTKSWWNQGRCKGVSN